jgi:formate/nitrite transporter FocA (FNT family)
MFFIPMGMMARGAGSVPEGLDTAALSLAGLLSNLSAATLGNIVGGAMLFAGIYWLAYKRGE